MKLGKLISEEVKLTLTKLAKEQLPFDVCLRLIEIMNIAEKKEIEFDELRMELLSKYGSKNSSNELIFDDKDNVIVEEVNIAKLAEELSLKYNEKVITPSLKYEEIKDYINLTYSCEELLNIRDLFD